MTQADVGSALSLSAAAVGHYESERRSLTADLISKFCDLFDVTADYLLGRSTQPHSAVSDDEARLLAAYNAAPDNVREVIDEILAAYVMRYAYTCKKRVW